MEEILNKKLPLLEIILKNKLELNNYSQINNVLIFLELVKEKDGME